MEFKVCNGTNKSKIFCSVFGCNSKACRSPHLSFHRFPRPNRNFVVIENKRGLKEKIDVLTAWKNALKFGKPVSQYMVVCSLHFKKTDYFPQVDKAQRRKLKKTAVPSVNLPLTTHPLLKKKKRKGTTVIPESDVAVKSKRLKQGAVPHFDMVNLDLYDSTKRILMEQNELTASTSVPIIDYSSKILHECNRILSVHSVGTQAQLKPLCNSKGISTKMSPVT